MTIEEVLVFLRHIKVDKSQGPNQEYPGTLWKTREEIADICASSLTMGEVLEDF